MEFRYIFAFSSVTGRERWIPEAWALFLCPWRAWVSLSFPLTSSAQTPHLGQDRAASHCPPAPPLWPRWGFEARQLPTLSSRSSEAQLAVAPSDRAFSPARPPPSQAPLREWF